MTKIQVSNQYAIVREPTIYDLHSYHNTELPDVTYARLFSGDKEGNILFSYIASDIWQRTTQIARGNLLLPHRLLFPISSKGSFICIIPDRIIHTTAFVTPVVEHWLEREIAQWVHPMKDRSDVPSHHERTLLPRSYISLLSGDKVFSTAVAISHYQVRSSQVFNVHIQSKQM